MCAHWLFCVGVLFRSFARLLVHSFVETIRNFRGQFRGVINLELFYVLDLY